MNEKEILEIFKQSGALTEGHFILTSGLHSPQYIEKFRLLENPGYTVKLCSSIIDNFKDDNISIVAGPMTGGIILAYECARQLGVKSMFTERDESGAMKFRRGFRILPQDTVLIVEDIITTGGSVKQVIEEVTKTGAKIAGLGYIADRSNGKAKFDIKAIPLIKMNVENYKPEECPLCKEGKPAIKPGSRKSN